MKIQLNIEDKNYLASIPRFQEELTEFLSKWGYNKPRNYQNFHYSSIDMVYQIDRFNLDDLEYDEEEEE